MLPGGINGNIDHKWVEPSLLEVPPTVGSQKKIRHGHIESTVSKKQIYILLNFDQGNGNNSEK